MRRNRPDGLGEVTQAPRNVLCLAAGTERAHVDALRRASPWIWRSHGQTPSTRHASTWTRCVKPASNTSMWTRCAFELQCGFRSGLFGIPPFWARRYFCQDLPRTSQKVQMDHFFPLATCGAPKSKSNHGGAEPTRLERQLTQPNGRTWPRRARARPIADQQGDAVPTGK